jgi:hypothetical protein
MNNLSSFYHLPNQKQATLNDLPYIFLTSFCLRSARLRDQGDACCRSASSGQSQVYFKLTIDDLPTGFLRHYPSFKAGKLNLSELARVCDLSRTTVYKYISLLEQ